MIPRNRKLTFVAATVGRKHSVLPEPVPVETRVDGPSAMVQKAVSR